ISSTRTNSFLIVVLINTYKKLPLADSLDKYATFGLSSTFFHTIPLRQIPLLIPYAFATGQYFPYVASE
ncbi:hypothetical protein NE599_08380, partial [[Clostridium] symbiosum]|uniref:hypothetical protein n=1 Tax=Clostridium symbiosum TaxID=1512 RepID=UPI00210936C4